MKKVFNRIKFSNLRNGDYVQLLRQVIQLTLTNPTVVAQLSNVLFTRFLTAADFVEKSYGQVHRSAFTEELDRLDKERDAVWRGMMHLLKGFKGYFEPAQREAAAAIALLMGNYGDVAGLSHTTESAAIGTLCELLQSPEMADAVDLLGLKVWVERLLKVNLSYDRLQQDKAKESAVHAKYSMKAARAELDGVFRLLLNQLEIMAELEPTTEALVKFVGELNAIFRKYETLLNQEQGHRDGAADGGDGESVTVEVEEE